MSPQTAQTAQTDFHLDPQRDLLMSRDIDVAPAEVWRRWTTPALLMPWFCPRPWRVTACEIELRPGGRFRTRMEGPDGATHDMTGCYLEVDESLHRLTFTSALEPGFRPAVRTAGGPPAMTATVVFAPHGDGGTRYTAIARHASAEDAQAHAAMGFEAGWGAALEQLVQAVRGTLPA